MFVFSDRTVKIFLSKLFLFNNDFRSCEPEFTEFIYLD